MIVSRAAPLKNGSNGIKRKDPRRNLRGSGVGGWKEPFECDGHNDCPGVRPGRIGIP